VGKIEKFRLELKLAIHGYATHVFVMLELKTKLLFRFFQFQLLVYEKLQFRPTPCKLIRWSLKSMTLRRIQRAGCAAENEIIIYLQFWFSVQSSI